MLAIQKVKPGFLTHSVGRGGRGVWGVWGVWGVRLLPHPPTLPTPPTPLGFLTCEKSRLRCLELIKQLFSKTPYGSKIIHILGC